ncbi:MAG TPA: protein kinase [Planctomycetota bacterium]|nr:protein kinase [Planctomycetota bacterium]
MALEPEQLLQRAVQAKALDEQQGRAALTVYLKLQQMGASFSFGDFLVSRGMLARMAVDTIEADTGEPLQSVDTLGDFELVEHLGEGASGAVFKALQKSLNREVAVKILNTDIAQDDEAVEQFLREARAVAQLNHPNVVHGYFVGTDHGLNYFAMELLDGGSTRQLMEAEGGRLSEKRALEIVQQAALGLKAAHARGILHRDVKPDNILLTADGVAKLTDLGIAQVVRTTTDTGTFAGSPPYVAPEIIKGTALNDPRSDIYSLGATLFELLIGAPPFLADDPQEILRMHLDDEPLDVKALRPELNPRTATLVKLMLVKDPEHRALSAEIVANAIARILQELAAAGSAPRPAVQMRSPVKPMAKPMYRPARPGLRPGYRPAPRPTVKKIARPVQRPPSSPGIPQPVQRPPSSPGITPPAGAKTPPRPAVRVNPALRARRLR